MSKPIKITTIGQFKKFLLFLVVFFFGFFLFFLKPQTIEAFECNNGPNNNDGGGCGTPCHCGSAWTLYDKDIFGAAFCQLIDVDVGGFKSFISKVSTICPTGDVCRVSAGETGLRCGYCDCSFGPIYKACCSGSNPVQCEAAPGFDPVWLKGRCPPGTTTMPPGVTTCSTSTCTNTKKCGDTGSCDARACDKDSRSSSYTWTNMGCSSDCTDCWCGLLPGSPTGNPTANPTVVNPTPITTGTTGNPTYICTIGEWSPSRCALCLSTGQWEPSCANWGPGGSRLAEWCACELKCKGSNPTAACQAAPPSCSPVGQTCSNPGSWIDSCCRCGLDGHTGLDYSQNAGGSSGWCACASQYNYPSGWQSTCSGGNACVIDSYNGACPRGYVLSGGCCKCP